MNSLRRNQRLSPPDQGSVLDPSGVGKPLDMECLLRHEPPDGCSNEWGKPACGTSQGFNRKPVIGHFRTVGEVSVEYPEVDKPETGST